VWALPGCSSEGDPCSLSGQVTFDGKPVEDGDLRLDPIQGTPGQAVPAWISGGKYEIPLEAGLLAGKYRAWITATRRTGRIIRPAEPMPGEPREWPHEVQYIPAKYNEQSKLELTLTPGENTHEFVLKSGR
jgi:hypothetical protein